MAQLVEHILGKDEVPGSNPGISLKTSPIVRKYDRGFSFKKEAQDFTLVCPVLLFYITAHFSSCFCEMCRYLTTVSFYFTLWSCSK